MTCRIASPYPRSWKYSLRGNLHTHTDVSDGTRSMQETLEDYAGRGYDFLVFTDHDKCGDVEALDPKGMILIPGVEVSGNGPHILQIGSGSPVEPLGDRQEVINSINAGGALAIVNHPNWQRHYNHFPQEMLEALTGYGGMEIYNGCIRRLPGVPLATDRWDRLLSQGRRIWGHGVDDAHRPEDFGRAWDVVLTDERSPEAVLNALRTGSFYASTGVAITSIVVGDDSVQVETEDAGLILAVSGDGRIVGEEEAGRMELPIPPEASGYVRLECYGRGDSMAWTQPFFLPETP